MVIKRSVFVFVVVLLTGAFGCKAVVDNYVRTETLAAVEKLEGYSGTVEEFGLIPGGKKIVSTIKYNFPGHIQSEVIAPKDFAGIKSLWKPGSFSVYYPKKNYAIRIKGLPDLDSKYIREYYKRSYDWHLDNYNVKLLENSVDLLGRDTMHLSYTPKSKGDGLYGWESYGDKEYAMPLKIRITEPYDYKLQFTKIDYKVPAKKSFALKIPGSATVSDWNFAAGNMSLSKIKKASNFKIRLPETSLDLKKSVRVKGLIPAFGFWYESRPYFMLVTMVKDYGIKVTKKRGIVISDKKGPEIRLNFAGWLNIIEFKYKGVLYYMVGNVPYNEMSQLARYITEGNAG